MSREALGTFRYLVRYLTVWVVTTVVCLPVMIFTYALMLQVSGLVVIPLTMGEVALFAALTANWMGNFLFEPDRSRGRLLTIVGATEAAGTVVAVSLIVVLLALDGYLGSPIYAFTLAGVLTGVVALSATEATRRLRVLELHYDRDAMISLDLVCLAVVAYVVLPDALCDAVVSCGP